MSTLNPGGRRSLDGPMRRTPSPPLNLRSKELATVPAEAVLPAPSAPIITRPESPVFEYRKPVRFRGGVWKWGRRVALGLLLVVVVTGGFLGFKTFAAARNIIVHSNGHGAAALAGILKPAQLKGEGDGRVNILVLGIGGAGHDGPNLSDTMMVWSIDPQTKDVAMLSIPRDLYVKIPGHGYGKINSANALGGPALSEQVVENVIGVPIHYYAVVDFSGFKQAVDAVGGVDINVPTVLKDPLFPCDDGTKYAGKYCPIFFTTGLQHMAGARALQYSRSRETTSDFARAARQQQVIVALRQKALQLSTLTNPIKLTGLIDAVGGHLKTDLQFSDMERLASIVKGIDPTKITQKVLDTVGPTSILIDGTNTIPGAGSIELPRAGRFDYSDLQDFVKNIFVDHYITGENARIEVQNGSGIAGLAGTVTKSLLAAHYNVGAPLNSADPYPHTVIYDYTGGKKPYTINYLQRRFGVKATTAPAPTPTTDANGKAIPGPQIRIILGSDYTPAQTAQ